MYTKIQKKDKIRQKRENKKKLLNIVLDNALSDCYSVILSNRNYFTDQDINNIAFVSKLFYSIISDKYAKMKIVRLIIHCSRGKILENAFIVPDKSLDLFGVFDKENYSIHCWSWIVFTKNTIITNNLQMICHACKHQRIISNSVQASWCNVCNTGPIIYNTNITTKFNTNNFI